MAISRFFCTSHHAINTKVKRFNYFSLCLHFVVPAAVQQLVMKKEVPAEQVWKPRQNQDSPDGLCIVEFQTIKEFMNQHSSSFPFNCGHVKSDAEIQSPQLHQRSAEEKLLARCSPEQMSPEADVEKCEEPHSMFGSTSDGSLPHSAEAETKNSHDDWMDAGEPQTAVNTVKVPEEDTGRKTLKKTFTCSNCGKVYWQKHNLLRHMRGHAGEKPFSCSLCGKTCTAKERLRQHMLIHPREKPAICPICGERFPQKGNLTGHMKIHAREKPR